jgi:hypothetical protein
MVGCGSRASASSKAAPHQHLSAAVGRCGILGGTAFYLCQPDFSITPDPGNTDPLRWTLTGAAKSSNGRKLFTDPYGRAQVQLQNGWPFGATGHQEGVVVRGRVAAGTIVQFSFAPTSTSIRGYAVWKLTRPASELRATTTDGGSAPELLADGARVHPTLVIAPSVGVHDAALWALFLADMSRLEAVADGHVAGACGFYPKTGPGATDASCAQAIGLAGKHAAIARSPRTAKILTYNGYTLAQSIIDGQPAEWMLDRGHFRFLETNVAD